MLSVSVLGIKDNKLENYKKIEETNCDYIHMDIMDGKFVPNNVLYDKEYLFNKKLDIHLMVYDVIKYIDFYKELNPSFITFHVEAVNNPIDIINYLKKLNIKVGISIKPNTSVEVIKPYLNLIDLVLVMSVEPGFGGQEFIENSTNKINELYELRNSNNYNYLIEVDGGINDITYKKVNNADIKVVGSFITKESDYASQIEKLKI